MKIYFINRRVVLIYLYLMYKTRLQYVNPHNFDESRILISNMFKGFVMFHLFRYSSTNCVFSVSFSFSFI